MQLIPTISVVLLHIQMAFIVKGLRYFDVRFINLTYELASPKIDRGFFELVTEDGIPVINGYVIYKEPVKEATVHVVIDIIRGDGKMYRVLDFYWNFCRGLKERIRKHLVTAMYTDIRKFGHMPDSCPMLPNINFTVNGFNLDAEQFPPYTPEMIFIANTTVFYGKEYAGNAVVVGEVKSKKKKPAPQNAKN